jgi:hypothetical protein
MVYHRVRTVNRSLSGGVLSSIAPTAVAQCPIVGHPTATLRRTILSFRMTCTILSAGSPHPPVSWISQVFPALSVQFDPVDPPGTAADPNTFDNRILQFEPLRKSYRPGADATELYAVDYWSDLRIDTSDQRKAASSAGHTPAVTAYLWTYDVDNWWSSSFWTGRRFDYQAEMTIIYSDLT